jgi:hypothetical protein
MGIIVNLLHKLKRRIQKKYISVFRLFQFQNNQKTIYESECISICKKLINKDGSILLTTPISNKKYIRNEENDIFVILDSNNVQVINHIYSYNVLLSDKSWDFLTSYFNNEVERRRIEFEREITSNIQHSLKNILTKL